MSALTARAIMTTPVITVTPQTPIRDAVQILLERHISGLPVVDEQGRLVGIVTRADVLKVFLRSDELMAQEARTVLEDFLRFGEEAAVTVDRGVVRMEAS